MATFPLTSNDDNLVGTTSKDLFTGPGGGTDTLSGLSGKDVFEIASGAAGTVDGGKGNDTVVATGFDLGTMSFTNVERLDLGLGGITASAAQLSAFKHIYTTDGTSDVQVQLAGAGGTIDFGSTWNGPALLHIDGFGAGDGTGYVIIGTHHQDFIAGSDFTDTISGGKGDDFLNTRDGNGDILNGDEGNDTLTSFGANAFLSGGAGKDTMFLYSGGLMNGGDGNDSMQSQLGSTFMGGLGADGMRGGAGNDQFDYGAVAESTGDGHDTIKNIDFTQDTFSVPVTVTGVDAAITTGALDSGATFDATLTVAVNAGNLSAGHAVLFTADAGTRAGHTFLIVDQNGVAGYQAGADLVIELVNGSNLASLATGNFV
jgi:Ca2+-binding RTX toxin-like protein